MKKSQLFITFLFSGILSSFAQNDSLNVPKKTSYKMTVEPGIGISPMPIMDMTLSNIVQVRITKRLSVISYTSIKENNLFLRTFNYIKSTNNYTLTQKLGAGPSFYRKRSIHTLSLLAGIKYDTYHETLNNPKFEKVDVTIKSWSPDVGMMYNIKLGKNKYYFSYRMYIPLFPYPIKTMDITGIDGNLANVSLEIGLGIRLK